MHFSASSKSSGTNECFCVGPQNGLPLCPCRMKGVKVENGRYVEKIDHGPVDKSLPQLRIIEEYQWIGSD